MSFPFPRLDLPNPQSNPPKLPKTQYYPPYYTPSQHTPHILYPHPPPPEYDTDHIVPPAWRCCRCHPFALSPTELSPSSESSYPSSSSCSHYSTTPDECTDGETGRKQDDQEEIQHLETWTHFPSIRCARAECAHECCAGCGARQGGFLWAVVRRRFAGRFAGGLLKARSA
ncbi:hypothetical protein EX30DRAFT_342494 [Ascodesmis nigricans]|uniref:Uncharacterized protein n=1 Tax=Ascodesmis nigricans TaxID=341454 RepID=A0A4S2MQG3_9PEZI|nr:hypothetical protein EX30DRAFT_342494 [Ascodesmis nigricans]